MLIRLIHLLGFTYAVPEGDAFKAKIWRSDSPDFVWPEDALEHLKGRDLGIAFSGGGFRAMALAQGAVRSLRQAGLLERTKHLGVSSGSAWFATMLYYQSQVSVDELIGKSLPLDQLTPEVLTESETAGRAITNLPLPWTRYPRRMKRSDRERRLLEEHHLAPLLETLRRMGLFLEEHHPADVLDWLEKVVECLKNPCSCVLEHIIPSGSSFHELWALVTGSFLMGPHHLADIDSVYCHVSELNRTRRLFNRTTVYPSQDVAHKLPFLVSQAAVYAFGSGRDKTGPMTAYPHENTLLYQGVPVAFTGEEVASERFRGLGGVLVEPIAGSSQALEPLAEGASGEVLVTHQRSRANFGALNEWSSFTTSPLAMVQISDQFHEATSREWTGACPGAVLSRFMNEEWIWSPHDVDARGVPITRTLPLGDAGVYDDNAHLPLLRRGLSKLVLFDNWAHQAEDDVDSQMVYMKAAFGQSVLSQGHKTKPGAPNPWMPEHFLTVFEPSEFSDLWARIQELKGANASVVVRGNFTVVDNAHWGIKGGRRVQIVFVIAHRVNDFHRGLPEHTEQNLPDYFPQMNSNELLDHFQLSALSQYASWLFDTAVVQEIQTMLAEPEPVLI